MYAYPLELPHGGADRKKSPLSDYVDASELINEELSGPTSFYYEKVRAVKK